MQFAYAVEPLGSNGSPSPWQSFNDPALLATLPAAALLHRHHGVKEVNTVYVFAPTREQLFNQRVSPANSIALRSAAEKGRLVVFVCALISERGKSHAFPLRASLRRVDCPCA
jgi:hypothetical protein